MFDWSYYQRRNYRWTKNTRTHGRYRLHQSVESAFSENRFGSTAEIGIYEMLGSGLVVSNLQILISHKDEELSGTVHPHWKECALNEFKP
jgi:predicted ATP-dependent serine protease